jgi:hypothetical protein
VTNSVIIQSRTLAISDMSTVNLAVYGVIRELYGLYNTAAVLLF